MFTNNPQGSIAIALESKPTWHQALNSDYEKFTKEDFEQFNDCAKF
jgi:hypothetical protein